MAENGMAYPRRFLFFTMGKDNEVNMTRITISLKDPEKTALRALAEKEFRDPRAQAALIIRQELERRGLLTATEPPALPMPTQSKGGMNVYPTA
jgi:hypothetical protein